MGYNRAGKRRTQRLKRSKRELTRLAAKMEPDAPVKKPAAAGKDKPASN
jgi:hypothetical protein